MNTGAIRAPITMKTTLTAPPSTGQARGNRRSTSYSTITASPPRTRVTASATSWSRIQPPKLWVASR